MRRGGCKATKATKSIGDSWKTSRRIHSAGKTGESRAATCITTDTTRSSIRSPTARRVENWSYRQRKEREVMRDAHDITSAGHLGIEKTFDRVKREYYWRGMYHDVHEYVRSCDTCQRYKIDQTGPRGLMGRRVIERPWSVIACDLMEFPLSKSQNKYLIVFVDLFTRWVEFKPVRRAHGESGRKRT
ncbi:unnamed protein product [Trichogramma brassicae]|uniref:Integrase zinc-binding domain-containing protein n=1 Tax=Trichogramma brassicae TaxID=86971 RepID=A0A6H5I0R9_9HYME|nr:unnamed protein product [Trichogramma brassicae]